MRLHHVLQFIRDVNPDILLLQEIKCNTDQFPYDAFSDLKYNCYVHGQKSYNGVAILSKYRADEVSYTFIDNPCSEQSRFLEIIINTDIGVNRVISLYAPNGGDIYSDKFEIKLKFYDNLFNYLQTIKSFSEKVIIGGDFNIAPFDIDVYSPLKLNNTTGFSIREKEKFRSIINSGFYDLYRLIHPAKKEFSWWDYRAGSFYKNHGMRIDMILASSCIANDFKNCYIDNSQRGRNKPSDHVPVVAYV